MTGLGRSRAALRLHAPGWALALALLPGCTLFTPAAPDMARAPVRTTEDPPVQAPRQTALERLETLLRENARLQSELELTERKLGAERKRSAELKAKLSALEAEHEKQRKVCAEHTEALARLRSEHQRSLDALLAERLARVRLEQQLVERQLEQLRNAPEESRP